MGILDAIKRDIAATDWSQVAISSAICLVVSFVLTLIILEMGRRRG